MIIKRREKLAQKNQRVRFDELENEPKKKKKKFNLFDTFYNKERTTDNEGGWHERTFAYFFPLLGQNITRLLYINLFFIIGNFPIFIIMLALSQNLHLHATSPTNPLYAPIYGAMRLGAASPASAAFSGIYGATTNVALWTTLARVVLIVGIVLLFFTFGPVMTGTTYIIRNIVKGEPIFLFNDFFYAIKKNIKQCVVLGILDLIISFLLLYDIYFFYLNPQLPASGAFIVISIFLLVLYFMMRFYMYTIMITFDLKLFKILKNSLIFVLLALGRNLIALVGVALAVVINYGIVLAFVPVGVVLPFILTISVCMFIYTYAAWPKIKKVMIDPYYDEEGRPLPVDVDNGAEDE